MKSYVVIAGLVAFIILGVNWANALANLPEVTTTRSGGLFGGSVEYVVSPEEVAEYRAQVNGTYGLWLAIIIGATGGLFYIANEKDKKAKELKAWYETEGKNEIEGLLKENNVNNHVENELDSKSPDRKEIVECPYCLEDIYAGAIKCKHCKTDLSKNI